MPSTHGPDFLATFGSRLCTPLTLDSSPRNNLLGTVCSWEQIRNRSLYLDRSQNWQPFPFLLQRLPFSSDYHSPAPTNLQRLPFSSDYHPPAPTILQRLLFSSDCHSPAPTNLQRPPFSSAYHSPAPAILQRPTILQRPPFSSEKVFSVRKRQRIQKYASRDFVRLPEWGSSIPMWRELSKGQLKSVVILQSPFCLKWSVSAYSA